MPTGLISPRTTPPRVKALGQSLGIVVAHGTGGEALPDRAGQVIDRVSVRALSMAAAIWSQKDMGSPLGGEARHRGGTHIGKAAPSPEMLTSGLTKGGFRGRSGRQT